MTRSFSEVLNKLLDVFLSTLSFWAAHSIIESCPFSVCLEFAKDQNLLLKTLLVIGSCYLSLSRWNVYDLSLSLGETIRNTIKAVFAALLILYVALHVFGVKDINQIELILFISINIVILTLSKTSIYAVRTNGSSKPNNNYHILVVGAKKRAQDVVNKILARKYDYLTLNGCVEIDDGLVGKEVAKGVKVVDHIRNLERLLRTTIIDEIIFAIPLSEILNCERYFSLAEEMGISVRIIPNWQPRHLVYRMDFEEFIGIPTLALHKTPRDNFKMLVKKIFDYFIAANSLFLLSPLMLIIAAIIKISDKGPIIFTQERCGLNGRRFRVYKFRTMEVDAEKKIDKLKNLNEADGPVFKIDNDPRIIPYIGKFLRKTGLDELPQLFNVLQGEMSIVGPRPPIPSEVNEYDTWHRRRLSMKPGITCTWQIQPKRNEKSFEDWMRLDLEYIDNWNLWCDFLILLKTFKVIFRAEGR